MIRTGAFFNGKIADEGGGYMADGWWRLSSSRTNMFSIRSNKSICKHENLYWRSHYETLYKPPFYYIVTGNRNNMCNGVL
jgi:hypothetical protein